MSGQVLVEVVAPLLELAAGECRAAGTHTFQNLMTRRVAIQQRTAETGCSE